jgi:ubiquinone/menaquinone biosynthesis C-methylase UbiE
MRRLAGAVELLDGSLDDPAALDGNLRDLRRINRWLGGVALSIAAVEAVAPGTADLTLLDIGTGGADIPLALLRWATTRGRRLTVVALDSRPEVLAAARRTNPAVDRTPALTLEVGEGTSLPHDDGSFDVTHASLVLHHLEPDAAVALLREMGRVARLGVVVKDLDRGWLAWLGAWLLGHLLTRNRYTRRDAPLSVRRAYRREEMTDLVQAAGLTPVRTRRGSFGQRYSIAAVSRPPGG